MLSPTATFGIVSRSFVALPPDLLRFQAKFIQQQTSSSAAIFNQPLTLLQFFATLSHNLDACFLSFAEPSDQM
jgi:hypothetical protein